MTKTQTYLGPSPKVELTSLGSHAFELAFGSNHQDLSKLLISFKPDPAGLENDRWRALVCVVWIYLCGIRP